MKIAIAGAGAGGIFCAANLPARHCVKIFEAQNAPLKKLLATGGGRCNFTNKNIDCGNPENFYPRGGRSLRKVLRRFTSADAAAFFERLGVPSKTEDEGRVFPCSDNARDIANALLKNVKGQILTNSPVARVQRRGGKFEIALAAGETEIFDAVILAVGGRWAPALKASLEGLGHAFEPEIPSLYGLRAEDASHGLWKAGLTLASARLSARFGGAKISASGDIVTTHFGISGPAALKFSSFAAREMFANNFKCKLFLNALPRENPASISAAFSRARQAEAKKRLKNFCPFALPAAFWEFALARAGVSGEDTYANFARSSETKLLECLTNLPLSIAGKSPAKGEFVVCGGLRRAEFDFSTMQSKKVENLFALGECLDIDAITGGYNLHAAFATAKAAADFFVDNRPARD